MGQGGRTSGDLKYFQERVRLYFIGVRLNNLVNGFTFLSERKKQKIIPLAVLTDNKYSPCQTALCILFVHSEEWVSCLECQGDLPGFELN